MLVLYDKNESSFNTLGYGVLRDLKSDAFTTEVLNGVYNLEFSYIKEGWLSEYLVEGNIIKADGQLFRIRSIKKNINDNSINVFAKHIWFDNEFNNWIEDVAPTNKVGHTALAWLLNHAKETNKYTINGDCTTVNSARYVRMNPIEAIYNADNALLDRFGGEVELNNYNVFLHNHRGSETGIQIRQDKNLSGAEYNVDLSTIATRIMPVGKDGILLPEKYVDSPYINNYYAPFYYKLDVNIGVDEDENISLNDCYTVMRNEANNLFTKGIDKPNVTISIDFVELSKTKEYSIYSNLETAHLGDSCNVYIPGLNISVTTRIVKIIKNCNKNRITNIELGTPKIDYVTNNSKNENNLKKAIIKSSDSVLSTAKKDATNLINHPFEGYIYISENTGELFIMDTNDVTTATNIWKFGLGGIGFSSTGINGPYQTAITQDGKIVADFITTGTLNTSVINGYGSLTTQVQQNTQAIGDRSLKTSTITQDISSLQSQISDIADITVSATTNEASITLGELDSVASSYPIKIEIHPIMDNISYLYPNNGLYPSSNTYIKHRKIIFTNHSTNETFEYNLPQDLLYYDSNNYDEFIADYEANSCKIIKRCSIDSSGVVSLLPEPIITNYNFSEEIEANLDLTEGNYSVSLYGYSSGYLFVRLMAINAYSAQYATKVELNSSIEQTVQSITSTVSQEYETKENAYSKYSEIQQTTDGISSTVASKVGTYEIISKINQSPEQVQILANKIYLSASHIIDIIAGNSINLTSKNITINSNNFNVDANGNLSCSNANISGTVNSNNGSIGGWSINSSGLTNGSLFIKNNGYSNIYTYADMVIMRNYLLGKIDLSENDISHYDLNGDGIVNSADLYLMRQMIIGN